MVPTSPADEQSPPRLLLGQMKCSHPVEPYSYQQDHTVVLGERTKGSVDVCAALYGNEFGGLRPKRSKRVERMLASASIGPGNQARGHYAHR
jgi:hypothetical protein